MFALATCAVVIIDSADGINQPLITFRHADLVGRHIGHSFLSNDTQKKTKQIVVTTNTQTEYKNIFKPLSLLC